MADKLNYEKIELKNGITVILCPIETVESLYIRVDLKNGAIFENQKNAGISHILEHYLHQGNTEFPKAQEFTLELEKEGMFENAATYLFGSYFWIKSPASKTEKTIQMLFSLVATPTFPQDRLNHVREVVLQEYYDHWQHPQSVYSRDFAHKRFTDKPVYLNDTLGTKEVIEALTVAEIREWFEKFYHAGNMLITIAGNIKKENVLSYLEKTFGSLPNKGDVTFPQVEPNHYSSFLVHHHPDTREQITFSLSFPAFGWNERGREGERTLNFLARLTASFRFSRLYYLIREQHNLVYSITASAAVYPSRGYVGIYGSTSIGNLIKAFTLLKKEIEEIKKSGFTDEEVRIAKNIYESGIIFEQETPEAIAGFIKNQEFWKLSVLTPPEYLKEIHKITKDNVDTLAQEVFDFKKPNIGLFGNLSKETIDELTEIFK